MRRAATTFSAACLFAAFIASGLGSEVDAFAQQPPAKGSGEAAPSASKRAEDLAAKGYEQQAAGKYSDAIGSYLEAYKVSGAAVILFNVAAIYDRKLHEEDLASDYYRRYLGAVDTDPDLARKATNRLEELKQAAKDREAASKVTPIPTASAPPAVVTPAPIAAAPAPPVARGPEAQSSQRTLGLVVGGVGIATLGVSAAFSILAKVRDGDANAFCNGNQCTDQQGVDLAKSAGNAATVATATFIGGAVLLAAGVGLYVFSPSSRSKTGGVTALRVGAHGTPAVGWTF